MLDADHPVHRLSPGARSAWGSTLFAALPPQLTASLLERAVEVTLAPREVFYPGAHHAETPLCAVVVDGLLRFYLTSPDGRAMTVRYAGHGQLVGVRRIAMGLVPASSPPPEETAVNGEALQTSRILTLPATVVAAAARNNATLSGALAREIAVQAVHDRELIAANVFRPIRERVARHLINLATREGPDLVVHASHQEIANAIGSVREVVSRSMCRFRAEGLVERRRRRLVLTNPARLHAAAIDGHPCQTAV
ncbi:Crp/Fnr family transcriptional regulator [Micromonospora sp. NPDC000207]|uniref:Crp/Fnr family transcriptional regulator n=1 Tax=Micromonospora sp. NPDC000207 TaxID=3154246 RepID=UPI0033299146